MSLSGASGGGAPRAPAIAPVVATVAVVAVVAIFGAAILTRFWRLGWGLGDGMAFADELFFWPSYFKAFVPLRPESVLRRDTPAALLYPTLYGNSSGLAVWIGHKLGLIGAPANDTFGALYAARVVSAAAGVANVGLVGFLGWRFYSPQVGLVAAALMAVVPLEAMQAHYASVDVLLGLTTTLGLIAACQLARSGSPFVALLAGVATGLAYSAKYTGLVVAAACAWATLEVALRARSWRPFLVLGPLALVGLAIGVGLGCPACVLQSRFMVRAVIGLSHISTASHLAFWNVHLLPSLGWYGRPYLYQLVAALPFALGWPLYVTALAGLGSALWRRSVVDRLLLVTLLAYFVPIGMSFVVDAPRYFIPMLPGLIVLAARCLVGPGAVTRGRLALVAAVWLYTLLLTLSQVERYSWEQQKDVARAIRQAFAGDVRVKVAYPDELSGYYGLRQPLIWNDLTPAPMPPERWLEERPPVIVVPEWFAIRTRRDAPGGVDAAVLERLRSGHAGYREAGRWHSQYLTSGLYTALDPAFASDLTQGEIGFRLYLREGD